MTASEFMVAGWRKSTRSADNGACVEFAVCAPDMVGVRDSKDPQGPVLTFDTTAWQAFVADVRSGHFDRK